MARILNEENTSGNIFGLEFDSRNLTVKRGAARVTFKDAVRFEMLKLLAERNGERVLDEEIEDIWRVHKDPRKERDLTQANRDKLHSELRREIRPLRLGIEALRGQARRRLVDLSEQGHPDDLSTSDR
jgi:hypothetical protein